MMSLKNIFKFFCTLAVFLSIPLTGWGQKLPSASALSAAARTPQQILADTRLFIGRYGHRPRGMFYQDGQRLLQHQLNGEQLQEVRLATEITNILQRAKKPTNRFNGNKHLLKLQQLVESNSNFQPLASVEEILAQTKAFIKQHQLRPRAVIYSPLTHYKTMDEMNEAERAEVRLARNVQYVLSQTKKENLHSEALEELAVLWETYNRFSTSPTITQLLEQAQDFIARHGHAPRASLTYKGKPIKQKTLTALEQDEVHLGRQILTALRQTPLPGSEEDLSLQALAQLIQSARRPPVNAQEILDRAKAWVATHNDTKPNNNLFRNGRHVPTKEMTPQEYEEVNLARQMAHLIRQAQRNRTSSPIIDELKHIMSLPTTPHSGQ